MSKSVLNENNMARGHVYSILFENYEKLPQFIILYEVRKLSLTSKNDFY